MQMVIRHYSGAGAKELFDVLEQHRNEVERLIKGINGIVSYTLGRTDDGGVSVTVCEDEAGIEESIKAARDFIAENAAHIDASPPQISSAAVITQVK
jgi:hypothetical protein